MTQESSLLSNQTYIDLSNTVPALKRKSEFDYALHVPGFFPTDFIFNDKIAAVIHVYHVNLFEQILLYLANIPVQTDLFISTDSVEKLNEIEVKLARYDNGKTVVRVFENRGRNIAPAFVGFRKVLLQYKYFVHLHTKKSYPDSVLDGWREYLFETLLGSKEIVNSILYILSRKDVGIVFAQHFPPVCSAVNWGNEYYRIIELMRRVNVNIDLFNVIDFPSGAMFFGKTTALEKLINMDLSFQDFPEEYGQTENTLTHAIERSFLYFAEAHGYKWVKVTKNDIAANPGAIKYAGSDNEITEAVNDIYFPLFTKSLSSFTSILRDMVESKHHDVFEEVRKYETCKESAQYRITSEESIKNHGISEENIKDYNLSKENISYKRTIWGNILYRIKKLFERR